jgi:hypothetical protein
VRAAGRTFPARHRPDRVSKSQIQPIGVQLGKVLPVFGQPMRFALNPQFDLKDLPGASEFKVLLTIQLLLPEKR